MTPSTSLTLTVSDIGGDVTAATAITDDDDTTVTVLNVPPTVTAVGDNINEGGVATVRATFFDPGTLDTHTATILWGDGSPGQRSPSRPSRPASRMSTATTAPTRDRHRDRR